MAEIICFMAAAVCAVYGCIVCANGSGTSFFLVWLVLAAALVALGVVLHMGIWLRLPVFFRRLFAVLIGVGLVLFIFVEGLVISYMKKTADEPLDVVIVLGAQMKENGPSTALRYRLDAAETYLKAYPDTICIVSGGKGSNEPVSEAEGMADYLRQQGIAGERLILEDQSRTTWENIKNSRAYISQDASVGIITNDFHMFRAMQIARKQGLTDAVSIAAPSEKLFLPNNMLREFFAEIKFLLL